MTTRTVTIIDLGIGNLYSVSNAFAALGVPVDYASTPDHLGSSKFLVLPGVGSYAFAMEELRRRTLDQAIKNFVSDRSNKLLGICLGFQLLGVSSTEDKFSYGLGLIPGAVSAMRDKVDDSIQIPHIGFNTAYAMTTHFMLAPLNIQPSDFYFVHSYCFADDQIKLFPKNAQYSITSHGMNFVSSYHHNNIFGAQFHPEKSQTNGLAMLESFLAS